VDLSAEQALARTLLLTRMHRLPDASKEAVLRGLAATRVTVVADEPNLDSAAAQGAVATLVGLVAACGMKIRLVIPPVAVRGYQPPLVGSDFRSALCELASDSVPEAEAAVSLGSELGDLVFVIGDSPWNGEAADAWRLGADPWCGRMLPVGEQVGRIVGDFPVGALAAATAAAAEPYRAALRAVAASTGCAVPEPLLLEPATSVSLRLAEANTPTTGFDFGALDMISGGALTTAALHALLRVEDVTANVRVWEPQHLEASNLNRYALMRRSMVGMAKVAMLERWQHGGLSIAGHEELVDTSLVTRIGKWAPWVFVGTDNVESRWTVQGAWPEHLVVAGTANFMAMVSEHDHMRACAGCLHAASENVLGDVPTASFVSYLGGLLAAARLLRWAVAGPSAVAEQATEAWADRLDRQHGFRHLPVPRLPNCLLRCGDVRPAPRF
jgi:hypothetical protein